MPTMAKAPRKSASKCSAIGILFYRTSVSLLATTTTRRAARKATRETGTLMPLARNPKELAQFQDMLKSTLILGASAS